MMKYFNKTIISTCFAILLIGLISLGYACEIEEPEELPMFDEASDIVGIWRSGESDLATLLSEDWTEEFISFFSDSSFQLVRENINTGAAFASSGEYIVGGAENDSTDNTSSIYPIYLLQTFPDTLTYYGIFDLNYVSEPRTLLMEVVQTDPELADVYPPDINEGFASSSYGLDALGTYREQ